MRKHILNERIKGSTIRLVGHEKFENDIINTKDALLLAKEDGLDLVLINPNESPVICKIMDYSKFLYNQKKVEKKNHNVQKLKEVKFSPNISDNDLGVKIKQARKFLKNGSNVRVELFFKGREISHKEIGEETLLKFLQELTDVGIFDLNFVFKGKKVIHNIRPRK